MPQVKEVEDVVPHGPSNGGWLKLLDQYQMNIPPLFKGETDDVTAPNL